MMRVNPLAEDLDFITEQTRSLWDEARGKRFFITGGTGFFGCWLLESFCHANRTLGLGASATVLTRDPRSFAARAPHLSDDPAVELLAGDVRSFNFPSGEFAYVVHAATDPGSAHSTELELLDTIVEGTRHVLQFAVASGVQKLVLTSSGAVYGTQPPELEKIEESFAGAPDLISPRAFYGEGKRMAELLCHAYSRGSALQCKVARCFAFVGPHLPLDAHFAIGNFIGNALRREPLRIRGDGTPLRSYLYMADAMIWLWTILFRAPSVRPYNLGSDQALNIRELAQRVADVLSPGAEIIVEQQPVPGKLPMRYVPSTALARQELGLSPLVDLDEAIRRTANWYKNLI
jgi:dTDP-glucose 4,6-dehydratase